MEITSFNFVTNYSAKTNVLESLKWFLKDSLNMLYKNIVQVLYINVWVVTGAEARTLIDLNNL